ncbi:hypothetical protein [Paraburkholderia humisilvae]|uniref:Uncharacterized protein n=1 Tax=Paraburkholderia humisilvae TaxID=627669 RepID=A0A6J5F0D0_9BURK|nr:hypothetical protein [Paraburkholderia humisilvae]CAB3771127.1 hypothetical protein LMG29542_06533 [Paraburkholderia humisilvae]
MPITVAGDDLNVKSVDWDHLLTQHGLEGCNAAMTSGWQRKSKWYDAKGEEGIKEEVNRAFDMFRQHAKQQGTVTLQQDGDGRSVVDVDVQEAVGTGLSGSQTTHVRLVLEVKHSGDTHIVTAFPL